MPVRPGLLSSIARFAVYAAALAVLGTARLPQAATDTVVTAVRSTGPSVSAANAVWRLAIAGILLTGMALDLHRRRPQWL